MVEPEEAARPIRIRQVVAHRGVRPLLFSTLVATLANWITSVSAVLWVGGVVALALGWYVGRPAQSVVADLGGLAPVTPQ